MSRIVLVEPAPTSPPIKFMYRPYVPLALLSIAAPLVREGYDVRIIDQRLDAEWEKALLGALTPDTVCVGVTSLTGSQLLYALRASQAVKLHIDLPVVWGGIHASLLPEQTLQDPHIDYVIQGEGEETIVELVQALEKGASPEGIHGLWYKENGQIRRNPPRPFLDMNTLDRLPYNLLDPHVYHLHEFLEIPTSRGCSHRCGFCYNLQYNKRTWRTMKVERILEDLEYYVSTYNPKNFVFREDNFFQSLSRVRQICRGIVEAGHDFTWRASCKVSTARRMEPEDFSLLRDSGFKEFGFGMESGSPRVLALMNKDITVEDTLVAAQKVSDAGFSFYGSFVGGYPGESEKEFDETIAFITRIFRKHPSFSFVVFLFVPYPGTDSYDQLGQYGFEYPERIEDWAKFCFPFDRAITSVGAEGSFYSMPAGWMTERHKKMVFRADLLSQVAGCPLYLPRSRLLRLLGLPYNLPIHIARFRWAHGLFGRAPELYLLRAATRAGVFLYRKVVGKPPS